MEPSLAPPSSVEEKPTTEDSTIEKTAATPDTTPMDLQPEPKPEKQKKPLAFWLVFLALCTATLLVAIDLSIVAVALPTITTDLDSKSLYVWIANAYVLSSTVVQPLYGQTANIFGRRNLTLFAITTFLVGSGICGGAKDTPMLIAGRTVKGIGGGGIIALGEIIMCDMVPLRERGKYTGLIAATYAVGTVLGPILGGVFSEKVGWRWIFWINLPIGGVALLLTVCFLHLKYPRQGTIFQRLRRVDFAGNAALIASVTAILIPLSIAGTTIPWSSWRTLVPLILGLLGLVGFGIFEASGLVAEPTMSRVLFQNRTSISIMGMGFAHGVVLIYVSYMIPIYFQAVRELSPLRNSVVVLPISFAIAPAAGVAGAVMSITGRYRPFHFAGWILIGITMGCFSLFNTETTLAVWVILLFLFGIGCGICYSTMIPPLLASVPATETATATATWGFIRSFGSIWGVAIPSAIFNTRVNSLAAERLSSVPEVAAMLLNGGAYEKATKIFMQTLRSRLAETMGEMAGEEVMRTLKTVYIDALNVVWWASVAWAVLGIIASLGVQNLELTKEMNEDFGMEDKKKTTVEEKV